ncbi:MAG: DUF4249 domain-containing protein [Saprospiraceae bacterium]|nr:DUF4249 domain-containing protein [Saprospiraceae bacterium]
MKVNIFLSLFFLFLLTISCEKVIDIDLNEANPKPVFEAYMENDSTCYVKAAWTSSYYDNSSSPAISNASMTISDQTGNSESMLYQGNGIYKGTSLLGVIGNTYTLDVVLEGVTYTATSTMPPLTVIDSCSTQPLGNFFGGGGGPGSGNSKPKFWVFANYTDSVDYINYYAIRTSYYNEENEYVTDYRISDDDLTDGLSTRTFTTFNRFESGDTVTIEFASIDRVTHLYFKTLEDAISGAGFASAAPANPTNNFTNGALGYFGAWSKDREVFILP